MTGSGHPATERAMPPALPPAPPMLQLPRLPRPRLTRRLLTAVAAAAVVGLIAFNVGRQAFVGWGIDSQAAQLEAEVAAAEAEITALQRQLEYLQSDAYVTAEARRLRNLGYPGEQLMIIPPGAAVSAPETDVVAQPDDRPMLERWLALFFGPSDR